MGGRAARPAIRRTDAPGCHWHHRPQSRPRSAPAWPGSFAPARNARWWAARQRLIAGMCGAAISWRVPSRTPLWAWRSLSDDLSASLTPVTCRKPASRLTQHREFGNRLNPSIVERRNLFQYESREPKGQRRDIGHEREHDQHRDIEHQDASRHRLHAHTADRTAHDHGRSDWRGEQSDPKVEDHDDAEMHGIDAELFDDRQEYRRADQEHRCEVHEGAEQEQQYIDPKQKRI